VSFFGILTHFTIAKKEIRLQSFRAIRESNGIITIGLDTHGKLWEYFRGYGWFPFKMSQLEEIESGKEETK
jgi:hypothetical protein